MVSTLDLHANLSSDMVNACDAMIPYRTYPHLDQHQRGLDAARLIGQTLRGEIRPVQYGCFPPFAIGIDKQSTSAAPCRGLYELAEQIGQQPRVLNVGIVLGCPYSDVPEMGTAFVVTADGEAELARSCAEKLGAYVWRKREQFLIDAPQAEAAVSLAIRHPGPVLLLDMGDNIGCATPGDGTCIAHALLATGDEALPAFICIADSSASETARRAGVGRRLPLVFGGKSADMYGPPIESVVTVVSLHDGRFEESEPRHSALTRFDMGPTAVIRTDEGLTVMLTSEPTMPFSLNQLTSCDVDPAGFRIIVAKGVHAPLGAYESVCPTVFRVNTPGLSTADMESLNFQKRRRPMYPFERDTHWSARPRSGSTERRSAPYR